MPLYEHVFLTRQDISAQQVEALIQGFARSSRSTAARSARPNIGE